MSQSIVEIRDYTFEAQWFEAYKKWAVELATPWLKANMDIIDFWVDCGIESEVGGADPRVSAHGQANICWIIRWPSKVERDTQFAKIMKDPQWQTIWAKHPNEKGYLHMNTRFMKSVTKLTL
jgi:uncharacterized protein YbaA (DUF1428 family)